MKILFLTAIVLILVFIVYSLYTNESFSNEEPYLKKTHILSYFETNPLVCYVSKSEQDEDVKFFENIIGKEFPYSITTDPDMKFKADLAILPETILLNHKDSEGNYPYNFMSHITDMSFCLIQLDGKTDSKTDSKTDDLEPIMSFYDLNNRHIYLKKGGYVQELFESMLSYIYSNNLPKITYYTDDIQAQKDLSDRKCDAIGTLMSHPNVLFFKMSYDIRINIVPWDLDERLIDVLAYHFKVLKKTKISLKNYRYSDFNTELTSYGYTKSLFINKNLPDKAVNHITDTVFQKNGVIRSISIGGSLYIPFHNGTKQWLQSKGLISITNGPEHPSCTLLAGKTSCSGKNADFAKLVYQREFWGSKIPNDQSAYSFIKNSYKKRDDPEYGKVYQNIIENSYMCIEDLKYRTKKDCIKDGHTWDKPCLKNDECPFYKKNVNYPNNFGQCINGFCEMPLGVVRKGFTQFDTNFKPICHNCPSKDPHCCHNKKNIISPDYAFKKDHIKRLENIQELELRGIKV